jgi:hypothetical protein
MTYHIKLCFERGLGVWLGERSDSVDSLTTKHIGFLRSSRISATLVSCIEFNRNLCEAIVPLGFSAARRP